MKKLTLILLALVVLTGTASANEVANTTRAISTLNNMFVQNGAFGFPPFASDPFTCGATTERGIYYNTASHATLVCNGTAWVALGGALVSPITGDFVATGTWTFGTAAGAANSWKTIANGIEFEGSSDDTFELSLTAANPGADVSVVIPATAGTLATLGNVAQSFTNNITSPTVKGTTSVQVLETDAANAITLDANGIVMEGSSADGFETTLKATDPTVGDQSYALPNRAGVVTDTIATLGADNAFTGTTTGTGVTTFGGAAGASNTISFNETAGQITIEGATSNTIQTRLIFNDPATTDKEIIFPAANFTVAGKDVDNAFNFQTFNSSGKVADNEVWYLGTSVVGQAAAIGSRTAMTPDGTVVMTGSTANSLHVFEIGDNAYDFNNGPCGTSACTDPTLIVHSHNQATNEYGAFLNDGTNTKLIGQNGSYKTTLLFAGATGLDKTVTIPNATGTLPLLEASNSFTGQIQYFTNSANAYTLFGVGKVGYESYVLLAGSTYPGMEQLVAITPDSPALVPSTVSNSWHMLEAADVTYDFNNGACGTAACTDPAEIIHSHNQDTTQYRQSSAFGSVGGGLKTLTTASATEFVRIPVPTSSYAGGEVRWTVFFADATDQQALTGRSTFAAVNKGGTETCTLSDLADSRALVYSDGGKHDLACTITCVTGLTNVVGIAANCASAEMTETTLTIKYSVDANHSGELSPQ